MAYCKHLVGFLSLRECGVAAVAQCLRCKKPLCPGHKKTIDRQTLCPECGLDLAPPGRIPPDLERERERRAFYQDNHCHPYVAAGAGGYAAADYLAFTVAEAATDGDGAFDPDSFQDS